MENTFQKLAGYCLILGSILLVLTMFLHPSGGNVEHIIKISKIAIVSHSLGILSIPFLSFGFYGLAHFLLGPFRLSYLAYTFMAFGLIAIMLAAALNGLILPMYVLQHQHENNQNLQTVKLIIDYDTTFNAAMDYIFISGFSIAMFLWSVIIQKTKKLPNYISILGFSLLFFSVIALYLRLNFISVVGFTMYVLGIVSWVISCGFFMIKAKCPSHI